MIKAKKIRKFIWMISKKLLSFILVFALIFQVNVFDAIKIVYADIVEDSEIVEEIINDEVSENETHIQDNILEEETNNYVEENEGDIDNINETENDLEENEEDVECIDEIESDIEENENIESIVNDIDDEIENNLDENVIVESEQEESKEEIQDLDETEDILVDDKLENELQDVDNIENNLDDELEEEIVYDVFDIEDEEKEESIENEQEEQKETINYIQDLDETEDIFVDDKLENELQDVENIENNLDDELVEEIINNEVDVDEIESILDEKELENSIIEENEQKEIIDNEDISIFTANPGYTITLSTSRGSVSPNAIYTKTGDNNYYNSSYTVTSVPIPSETTGSYTFNGWWTSAGTNGEGSGTQIFGADGSVKKNASYFTSNATIYAGWKKRIYKITLSDGGGFLYEWYNVGIYADSACNGSTVSSITIPTKTGQTFKGYMAVVTGGMEMYISETGAFTSALTKTSFTSDKVLTAFWAGNIYTITLNPNTGSGGTTVVYEKYNNGIYSDSGCTTSISSITKPTKDGYTFRGYFSNTDGTGTMCIDGSGYVTTSFKTAFAENKTIYAHWVKTVYTISLNNNDGTGVTGALYEWYNKGLYGNEECNYSPITNITPPTRAGCVFDGYYSTNNAMGGIKYIDSYGQFTGSFTKTTFTSNTTIYARWYKIVYYIGLDKNNGSGGTSAVYEWYENGIYGDDTCNNAAITSITKPTRTGYTFKGYFSNNNGT